MKRISGFPWASRAHGFTLLEMLVVLVIIGLLAGLVGPRLFSKVDQSKVQTAQTQIKLLRGAVENVRLDIGRYPTLEEGLRLLTGKAQEVGEMARSGLGVIAGQVRVGGQVQLLARSELLLSAAQLS